jgi:hypothetical protein
MEKIKKMNKEKNIFYAVYEVLENDEVIRGVFDYSLEVVEFLENKIDVRHLSTYIKNEYIIILNNRSYKVYKFKDNE